MTDDNRLNLLKKAFIESVIEKLEEESLKEDFNIRDGINFIKSLISKAKSLGISFDSDLENISESIELTEGFFDWINKQKDKIVGLILAIALSTNAVSTVSAMDLVNYEDRGNEGYSVEYVFNNEEDMGNLLKRFTPAQNYEYTYKKTHLKDIVGGAPYINRIKGDCKDYKLEIIDNNKDKIVMYLKNRKNKTSLSFYLKRNQLNNMTLKDFLKINKNNILYAKSSQEQKDFNLKQKAERNTLINKNNI